MPTAPAEYDSFAWIYNQNWGYFADQVLPIVDALVLKHLRAGARILDVCCGAGHLAAALVKRGYRVTGIDSSKEMIGFARENAPEGEFAVEDARTFDLRSDFDAALSTFDSLNHLMTQEELGLAFRNVFVALRGGGRFLFDLNMEEGFRVRWRGSFGISEDEYASVIRTSYRPEERLGRYDITTFRRADILWERSDFALTERCYSEGEVRSLLEKAGFSDIEAHDAQTLGRPEVGRSFFVCRRA